MKTWLAGLVGLVACCGVASGQGSVGMVIVEDPIGEPEPPTCGVGASYQLVATSPAIYEVYGWPEGVRTLVGVLGMTTESDVATGLPAAINENEGTCDWSIGTGLFVASGSATAVEVGVIKSDATLAPPGGESYHIRIGTFVQPWIAAANGAVVQGSGEVSVLVEGEEELPGEGGGTGANLSLGSSCSCPACPLGGRFWIPFVVIGIGQSPGGIQCCRSACDVACSKLHDGMSQAEAYAVGQGTWVLCMVCQ
ncbi:MAG: hypothetical protein IT433_10955 [Phycisphaerales bacterium]|nr:hypothetical protein [Phycisphaerales bacterium]